MKTYYNDNNPHAAEWLRQLQKEGAISDGPISTVSIVNVLWVNEPRAHFFAGIGGWDLALNLAGFPKDISVWTGSCPCQPFSVAGKQKGTSDPRHLWPYFRNLIGARLPTVVFGEQVASKAGRIWLDGVRADLEALGYEVGAADLCSAGVNAPHIRQRLFWVGYAKQHARESWRLADESGEGTRTREERASSEPGRPGLSRGLGDLPSSRLEKRIDERSDHEQERETLIGASTVNGMEHPESHGRQQRRPEPGRRGIIGGCWDSYDALPCTDGKTRRVEAGTFPLAHGVPGRVGLLRGYGNAINPVLAAEFVAAFMESVGIEADVN